jgi:Type II restriction endonuclease EcoO109I
MTENSEIYHGFIIEYVLNPFYQKRLDDLKAIKLSTILKRKNPYLFKAKNIELAGDFVKSIVDAHLSSQEETMFGKLLEKFAIFVSQTVDKGFKSNLKSIDLGTVKE